MPKIILTIQEAFAAGCMIFMLFLCVSYWQHGEIIFNVIKTNYDFVVLGIFIVALVAGGLGSLIYQTKLQYEKKVFLHYLTTILTVVMISIWLKLISVSFMNIFRYVLIASLIFFILWFADYMKWKKEAELINAALLKRKNQ